MTREEKIIDIIQGLEFTVDMFLFDPDTGEEFSEPRNKMDKITIDACSSAIEILKQEFVLDKIRDEIEKQEKWLLEAGYNAYNVDIAFNSIKKVLEEVRAEYEDKSK